MRKQSLFLIALGVGALLQIEARPAAAQVFGFGGNLTGLPYNYFQSQQELPFYAKFPPVYYSYPVARPYGYSPFAYPPGIMTPELHAGGRAGGNCEPLRPRSAVEAAGAIAGAFERRAPPGRPGQRSPEPGQGNSESLRESSRQPTNNLPLLSKLTITPQNRAPP